MMIFLASYQQIADPGPTRQLGLGQLALASSVESVDLINFANMVKNSFVWDLKITSNVLSSKIRTFIH